MLIFAGSIIVDGNVNFTANLGEELTDSVPSYPFVKKSIKKKHLNWAIHAVNSLILRKKKIQTAYVYISLKSYVYIILNLKGEKKALCSVVIKGADGVNN